MVVGRDPGHALMVSVAVLDCNLPLCAVAGHACCAVGGRGALARRGILVRNLQALDDIGGVDAVVFDKTGTLTQDAIGPVEACARGGVTRRGAAAGGGLAQHSLHPGLEACACWRGPQPTAMPAWWSGTPAKLPGQGVQAVVWSIDSGGNQVCLLRLGSAEFCAVAAECARGTFDRLSGDDKGWLATFELEESVCEMVPANRGALQGRRASVRAVGRPAAPVQRLAEQAGMFTRRRTLLASSTICSSCRQGGPWPWSATESTMVRYWRAANPPFTGARAARRKPGPIS